MSRPPARCGLSWKHACLLGAILLSVNVIGGRLANLASAQGAGFVPHLLPLAFV